MQNVAGQNGSNGSAPVVPRGQCGRAGPSDNMPRQSGRAGGASREPRLRQGPAPASAVTGAAATRGPAGSTSTQIGTAERGMAGGALGGPRLQQRPAPISAVAGAASTRGLAGSTSRQSGMAERGMTGGALRGPQFRQYPAPTLAVTGAAATRGRMGNATPTGRGKADAALRGSQCWQRLGPALSVTGAAATRRPWAGRVSGTGSAPSAVRAAADVASLPRRQKVAPSLHARADEVPRRRYTSAVFTLTVPNAGRPFRRWSAGQPGESIARSSRGQRSRATMRGVPGLACFDLSGAMMRAPRLNALALAATATSRSAAPQVPAHLSPPPWPLSPS